MSTKAMSLSAVMRFEELRILLPGLRLMPRFPPPETQSRGGCSASTGSSWRSGSSSGRDSDSGTGCSGHFFQIRYRVCRPFGP